MSNKKSPHVRLSAEEVKELWLDKRIKADGYLLLLLRSLKRDTWSHRIENISRFCKEWEISERAFYRAKAKLINEGKLIERIKGPIELTITNSTGLPEMTCHDKPGRDLPNLAETDKPGSLTDKPGSLTDKPGSLTDKPGSLLPSESSQGNASSDSPNLLQINTDLSLSHPPNPERENLQVDSTKTNTNEIDNEKLIQFIICSDGSDAKRPRAYAIACLKDDRAHWEEKYLKSLQPTPEAEPYAAQTRSKPEVKSQCSRGTEPLDPRQDAMARSLGFVRAAEQSPSIAIAMNKRVRQLMQEFNFSEADLQQFKAKRSVDVEVIHPEIVHPLETPKLKGMSDHEQNRQHQDKLNVAQAEKWAKEEDWGDF